VLVFHNRVVTLTRAAPVEEASGYSVSTVARRLGVASATLRSWDRRYGLSPSQRTAGSHRRYTDADIAVLEGMQSLMASGMPPGDAARAARGGHPGPAAQRPGETGQTPAKGLAQQRGLVRAATAMDPIAGGLIIKGCIERNGVVWTWDQVVAPVLRSIGDKCQSEEDGSDGIDIEHHLSHVILCEMAAHTGVVRPANPRPVLLASAREEQHTLPLYALAAALAERRICSRILGGRTPDDALAAAVRRTGPVAVFIYAHAEPSTDLARAVPTIRPSPCLIVGGPGWSSSTLPEEVCYPQDLMEAVAIVSAATQGSRS